MLCLVLTLCFFCYVCMCPVLLLFLCPFLNAFYSALSFDVVSSHCFSMACWEVGSLRDKIGFVFLPETFEEKNIFQEWDLNPQPPTF